MLKPLTLSLSLALAFGLTGVSKAGLFHNDGGCSTCGLASPQGPVVSPQCPVASPQVECGYKAPCFLSKCGGALSGFGSKCAGMGHDFGNFCKKLKPKPACYTYEWVLKKKKVHGGCGAPTCETCGPVVTPSSQVAPAPQAWPAPQAAAYGTSQYSTASAAGAMAPAPAPIGRGDEAPPAPEVAPVAPPTPSPTGPQSSLLFSTPSGN
jgi:hypothetical protein